MGQSLQDAIDGLINDYSSEEHGFGSAVNGDAIPEGRDSLPPLVDVQGAHNTGRLSLLRWEGSVMLPDTEQLLSADYRDQRRTIIARIQERIKGRLPSISFIIPALGNKLWGLECIDAISRQSLFTSALRGNCKLNCEIVLVQDGHVTDRNRTLSERENVLDGDHIRHAAADLPTDVELHVVELKENQGRSTARNIGARFSTGDVLVFLDCRMILDVHALAEMVIRHALCSDVAVLLGFKQNIAAADYFYHRHRIRSAQLRPAVLDGRSGDWKIQRDIRKENVTRGAAVHWRGRTLSGQVDFMAETEWLRNMRGSERIGSRSVGHFLSTALFSCTRRLFEATGGFDHTLEDSWGLEDSLLGIRLFQEGGKLIPCPTASAFLVEQPPAEVDSRVDALARNAEYVRRQLALPARQRPASHYSSEELPEHSFRRITGHSIVPKLIHNPVPTAGIEFTHSAKSSKDFELYFLELMLRCIGREHLVFTTETQHLPFIGRTLGQQKARHDDKNASVASEFHFYLMRHRYDLWEKLVAHNQIRLILDKSTLNSYFGESDNYFEHLDRYIQACRLLTLDREFPGCMRLAKTQVTESTFAAGDRELTYFNRLPRPRVHPDESDKKGRIRPIDQSGQNRIRTRWESAKDQSVMTKTLIDIRDRLRDDPGVRSRAAPRDFLDATFLNRLGLGTMRCVAALSSSAKKHSYQDAAVGSDGRQCWIVCDGVTPVISGSREPDPSRSTEVKKFAEGLSLVLLQNVTESKDHPVDMKECLRSANGWVRKFNESRGFSYKAPSQPTPFAAVAVMVIADEDGVRWASLGDCIVAEWRDKRWHQLNRHQTEDVVVATAKCTTLESRDQVIAQLRNHRYYKTVSRTYNGFGVLNGDAEADDLIEIGDCRGALVLLGSDGIRDAVIGDGTAPLLPDRLDPGVITSWFLSTIVKESSSDDKTLLVLARREAVIQPHAA